VKRKFAEFIFKLPIRLYVLIAAILAFAFFSNDFGLVDIQKTAIILAAGVDKADEEFTLTAQISVPKGDKSQGGSSAVNLTTSGKTVSDCVSNLYSETGWVPKFIFCGLIVLGEDTAKEDIFGSLDYFLRNEYMDDSCLVALCEGSAKELLTSQNAIDDTSSFAVEKLFSDAAEKSGRVSKTTLKELAVDYYGTSHSGYLPYLVKEEQTNEDEEGGSSQGGSGSGGESSQGQGGQKKYVYRASTTALLKEGKLVGMLDENQTLFFNLLRGKVKFGTITVDAEGKSQTVVINKNDGGVSLDMKGTPKIKLSLDLAVALYNADRPSPASELGDKNISQETKQTIEDMLTGGVKEVWGKVAETDCDLFYVLRDLYRSSPKKYEEWKDTLLSSAKYEPEISLTVSR